MSTNRTIQGIDAVLRAWRGWAKAFPDSRATFEEALTEDDTVVLCLRWRGTHSGPLSLPSGEILPTQRKIDVRACQLIRIQDDVVVEITHYSDMMTLLSRIGEVAGMAGSKPKARPKVR